MWLKGYTRDLNLRPKGAIATRHSSISRLTSSRSEVCGEKSMWLNECDPTSCTTFDRMTCSIRSGAYQSGSRFKSVQGSCLYQSPCHRLLKGGRGMVR